MMGEGSAFTQRLGPTLTLVKKALPQVPEEAWNEFFRGVTAEGFLDRIVPVYQKHSTEEDVKQWISFYQSPLGRKIIQTQPELLRDSQAVGKQWAAELVGQAVTRLIEKGYIQKGYPKIVSAPQPAYPPLARSARLQGIVKLRALIDRDGTIANLSLISGHPLLVNATMDAVKQWRYEPTLLIYGQAVAVVTEIDVNFTLQDNKAETPARQP
jgi:TonB family protein